MDSLILQWDKESNPQATFLSCYRMMTSNMLAAIDDSEFEDPAWVDELLHRFAGYYFAALEAYRQDPEAAPRVWQLAHDTARHPRSLAVENLLLGINAHINYDLVLTLVDLLEAEWPGLSEEERARRYTDYCTVNDVLARTVDAVQDQVLEPAMRGMALIDLLMGPLDELLVSRMITQWREAVWQGARRLLEAASHEERTSVLEEVEKDALKLGRLICLR
jgi:hypothetical protein